MTQLDDPNHIVLLVFPVISAAFIFFAYRYAKELSFYRKNNWDLELDSGIEVWLDWGSYDKKLTSSERLTFYYPLSLLVTLPLALAAGFVAFEEIRRILFPV